MTWQGEDSDYDLAIVGSGGAGFAAAIAASRAGHRVVMVERATVGGTCVNTGCVPSKALLSAAHARQVARGHPFPGIETSAGPVELPALAAGTRALVDGLRADKYVDLAASYHWEIIPGSARFGAGPVLDVALRGGGRRRITARHYLVASGSAPSVPAIDGLAETGYLTSTSAMELTELPTSLLVLGGGYVGLEQAQLFARLGSRVVLVEALDRLAAGEEPEVDGVLRAVFADEGIEVRTAATVTRVLRDRGQVVVTLGSAGVGQSVRVDAVLVATGRRPVTDGLGLEAVGVTVGGRGEVVADAHLRTGNPRIWAAGDVTGHPQFVYVAAAHGALVADNALAGANRTVDYRFLPRVTFTTPNVAAVGLTDEQAVAAGIRCTCRVLALEHLPRARVNRDTRGFVKVVADTATGRVVGVTVVAEGAGDVIQAAVYAVRAGTTVGELADTWAPYLTMAEGLRLAAQTFTRDVRLLSCCAS